MGLDGFGSKPGREMADRPPVAFEASPTEYGYAESVMIDGEFLYVRPVGKKGHQVCLDKSTGKLIWANTRIPGVESYTSPVIANHGGYKMLLGGSSVCYYGVDSKTGKLLWTIDVVNQQACNISDPVFPIDLSSSQRIRFWRML